MAKYAAIYMVLCAGIAALHPSARPGWKATAIALLAFAIAIAPNVIWNIQNGLNTVQHTLDNADWIRDPGERTAYNLSGMIEFFTSQFAVFGPIFFTALLVGWLWPGRDKRLFTVFALPIIAIVCVQAYLSQAYANWAVAAYLGGTLAVVPWLWKVARWSFWTSLVLHGGFAVLVPLATVFGETWAFGNPNGPALERYFGRAEMSNQILDKARSEGLGTVVSGNRDILADLFYTGRDAEIVIRAQPVAGRPPHHYALKFSYVPQQGESVLYVSRESAPLPECDLVQLGRIAPESGAYRKRPMILSRASSDCFRIP